METKMDNEFLMTFIAESEQKDLQMFCGRLLTILEPKQLGLVKDWFEVVIQLKKTKPRGSLMDEGKEQQPKQEEAPQERLVAPAPAKQEQQQPPEETEQEQEPEEEAVNPSDFDFEGFDQNK